MTGFVLRPSRTVVTSFSPRRTMAGASSEMSDYEKGDWVLCVASSSSSSSSTNGAGSNGVSTVSCSLSNGEVQVYDRQRLHLVSSYASETSTNQPILVKDLQYGNSGSTLVAAGQDGTIAVFDIRQQRPATKAESPSNTMHRPPSLETISLGFGDTLCAAGTNKGHIHFFDLRQVGRVLGTYHESHQTPAALAQVVFASNTSPILLSGGEDGLACCFDTRQPSEALALKSVLNAGTPLRRVGFCGDATAATNGDGEGAPPTVYCLTGSETASLWDWEAAKCLQTFGGFGLRQHLTQQLATFEQPAVPPFAVDYLVDAYWDGARRELILVAGNTAGEGALFRLDSQTPDRWHPYHFLKGGHRGVIRAWCPLTETVALSAGEDARLVEWERQQPPNSSGHALERSGCVQPPLSTAAAAPPPPTTTTPSNIRAGGPLRRQQQKRHKLSTSPY